MTTLQTSPSMIRPHTAAGARANRQIIGLDLIRFAASLLVMAFHLGYWIWAGDAHLDAAYHFLAPYTWFGYTGVEIFFVLSGFVIAYSAEKASASTFAKSRLIRLYPAAWICSTITLIVAWLTMSQPSGATLAIQWFKAFVLVPYGPWIDPSYWTLSVELVFYLIMFVLLATHSFRRVGAIMTIVGSLSTAAWLFVLLQPHFPGPLQAVTYKFVTFFYDTYLAKLLLLYHGSFFAIGVLLWLSLFRSMTARRMLAMLLCLPGCILEIEYHRHDVLWRAGLHFPPFLPVLLWLGSIGAILAAVKFNPAIHQFLGHRGSLIARHAGLITYPVYLIHQKLGYMLITRMRGHLDDVLSLLLVCCLAIALSILINHQLEKPLQDKLRHLLHGPRKSSQIPASSLP